MLFTGAGASVELGVPAMRPMVLQLLEHLRDIGTPDAILQIVRDRISERGYDLESLVEELDVLARGATASTAWQSTFSKTTREAVALLKPEVEWFITHVCERVLPVSARLLWSPSLARLSTHDVTIATTNYDRSIELAGAASGSRLRDGFGDFQDGVAGWEGFSSSGTGTRLLKLHGSGDWYHAGDRVVKLRHAMPLYGGLRLSVPYGAENLQLESAAILPSREKRMSRAPFPILLRELLNEADRADTAVFVGGSLRDPDIRLVATTCANRVPTYVVTRGGKSSIVNPPAKATYIEQTASQFLMSSLPSALGSDFHATLVGFANAPLLTPLLDWVGTALDSSRPEFLRCQAIEQLANSNASLGSNELLPLLKDSSQRVRLYAIALIPNCTERDRVLLFARANATESKDERALEELGYLQDLIEGRPLETR